MTILIQRLSTLLCFFALGLFTSQSLAAPYFVSKGYDVLQTVGAVYNFGGALGLQPFAGQPLGSFDFGGGPVNVGNNDTIIKRNDDASGSGGGDSDTISIDMVALSLKSVNAIAGHVGGTSGGHIITAFNSSVSTNAGDNTMNILFDISGTSGYFSSQLHILVDLIDEVTDTVLLTVEKTFTANGAWTADSTGATVLIPGVNHLLPTGAGDGTDDFFFHATVHDAGDGTIHIVESLVPAPASLALMLIGTVLLGRRNAFAIKLSREGNKDNRSSTNGRQGKYGDIH